MKRISIYATGGRNAVSRYRIWQYYDHIPDTKIDAHVKYSPYLYKRYAPIGQQKLVIKLIAWMNMCFRVTWFLLIDLFKRPDIIVVQRELVKKNTPWIANLLFRMNVKAGTKVIWDFDDHILEMKETTYRDFSILSKYSDHITVTHEYLKSLVEDKYGNKVILLHTTDGEMYQIFEDRKEEITAKRLKALENEMVVAWVATSGNIPFLQLVVPWLDEAAKNLSNKGIKMRLKVICNAELTAETSYMQIENIKWSQDNALNGLLNAHVGIMPLKDTAMAKGKGGFKLIQYMSVGLPCISSNVGFNKDIVGVSFGFLASNGQEWVDALVKLSDPLIWTKYSESAFNCWNRKYSYSDNLKKIINIVNNNFSK